MIGRAEERFTKNLYSDRTSAERPLLVSVADDVGQSDYIVRKVLENREAGIPLKGQAVLFRASSHSAGLEVELTRRNIPFVKFGGLKFLEAAHIKDVMAVLRWAQNPRDRVAGFRVLQLLPGIGPSTAKRVLDDMVNKQEAFSILTSFKAPAAAAEHWRSFSDVVRQVAQASSGWPSEIELICRWYEPHLERKYEDAQSRQADLVQLQQIAMSYPSRERFLTELTLDPPEATSAQAGPPLLDEEYLILSTIHSAKGQEWTSVFVLNTVDGCIPSDMATGSSAEIEEERRLLYVAMTRAKDQLHLIVPQRFYTHGQRSTGDRHVYASRTRFIPDLLTCHFGVARWPVLAHGPSTADDRSKSSVDIRSRMRAMWG